MDMSNLKKTISVVLVTLLFSVQASAQEYFMHTVSKGQGLYSISRMYGVTEDEIIKLNPGSEKVIKAGEQLKIPNRQQPSTGHFHTIQKGETLYRLSVENRVSVKEICDANPGLSADNFKIGQVITIPAVSDEDPLASTFESAGAQVSIKTIKDVELLAQDTSKYKLVHTVARRETIYKLCRMYDISQTEFLDANPEYRYTKLRRGAQVNIPYSAKELEERNSKRQAAISRIESIPDQELFKMNESRQVPTRNYVNAALILPLSLEDSATTDQKKMIEFYQGMLLALDKLKNERISVNLKLIDSKDEKHSLAQLFESGQLDSMDVVFGPKWNNHIKQAAAWSTKNHIPLVLPLNSNADDVWNNPYVYQLNTPQSYFYDEIYDHFFKQFTNPNIILLDADEFKRNDFIDGLKRKLDERSISYATVPVDTAAQPLLDQLVAGKQNIFIINSESSGPLTSMLPVLQIINRTKDPDIETHLFGYPEYQIYASDHLDEMYEVDTWFYSWFYTNNMLQESIDFGTSFRRAFSRQMLMSYPSFASYGYDTGYYFLKAISKYGKDFDQHLNSFETRPVQMGFKLERVNNWGGFINRKVFFVHFSNDYKVQKIDFDK